MTARPTPRELEVFETVCRVGSGKAAAAELGISRDTVRDTLHRMYRRIGADGIGHAAWLLWGPQAVVSSDPDTHKMRDVA